MYLARLTQPANLSYVLQIRLVNCRKLAYDPRPEVVYLLETYSRKIASYIIQISSNTLYANNIILNI